MKQESQLKHSLSVPLPHDDRLPLQDITHIVNSPSGHSHRRVSSPLPRLRPRSFLDENDAAQNPRPIKRRVSEHSLGPLRSTESSTSLSAGSLRAPPLRRSVSAANVSDRRRSSFFVDLHRRSSNTNLSSSTSRSSFNSFTTPAIQLIPPPKA